jgi:hypothetical protein
MTNRVYNPTLDALRGQDAIRNANDKFQLDRAGAVFTDAINPEQKNAADLVQANAMRVNAEANRARVGAQNFRDMAEGRYAEAGAKAGGKGASAASGEKVDYNAVPKMVAMDDGSVDIGGTVVPATQVPVLQDLMTEYSATPEFAAAYGNQPIEIQRRMAAVYALQDIMEASAAERRAKRQAALEASGSK